jgi:hypothetical protein
MRSEERLRNKVLQHLEAEINRILLGHWNPKTIHDQLIKTLSGYVRSGIITGQEAESIRVFAKVALFNRSSAISSYDCTNVRLTCGKFDQSPVAFACDSDNSLSMRWVKLGTLGSMNHADGAGGG